VCSLNALSNTSHYFPKGAFSNAEFFTNATDNNNNQWFNGFFNRTRINSVHSDFPRANSKKDFIGSENAKKFEEYSSYNILVTNNDEAGECHDENNPEFAWQQDPDVVKSPADPQKPILENFVGKKDQLNSNNQENSGKKNNSVDSGVGERALSNGFGVRGKDKEYVMTVSRGKLSSQNNSSPKNEKNESSNLGNVKLGNLGVDKSKETLANIEIRHFDSIHDENENLFKSKDTNGESTDPLMVNISNQNKLSEINIIGQDSDTKKISISKDSPVARGKPLQIPVGREGEIMAFKQIGLRLNDPSTKFNMNQRSYSTPDKVLDTIKIHAEHVLSPSRFATKGVKCSDPDLDAPACDPPMAEDKFQNINNVMISLNKQIGPGLESEAHALVGNFELSPKFKQSNSRRFVFGYNGPINEVGISKEMDQSSILGPSPTKTQEYSLGPGSGLHVSSLKKKRNPESSSKKKNYIFCQKKFNEDNFIPSGGARIDSNSPEPRSSEITLERNSFKKSGPSKSNQRKNFAIPEKEHFGRGSSGGANSKDSSSLPRKSWTKATSKIANKSQSV
jgi:hypothetical protein